MQTALRIMGRLRALLTLALLPLFTPSLGAQSVAISDRISAVQKAYYTVDYNDPQHPIGPLDGVFDGRDEKARFTVEDLTLGEHVISVQVFDLLDNVGVRQIVVEIK